MVNPNEDHQELYSNRSRILCGAIMRELSNGVLPISFRANFRGMFRSYEFRAHYLSVRRVLGRLTPLTHELYRRTPTPTQTGPLPTRLT